MNRKTPLPEQASKRSSTNYRKKMVDFPILYDRVQAKYRESSEVNDHNDFKMYIKDSTSTGINPRFALPARNITEKLTKQYGLQGYQTSVLSN